jgi:prepilin-type N-terminal cleavage/methylation domain-containing protein
MKILLSKARRHAKLPKPRNAEGFTLLEVLVAIVVLAIGLTGLLPMMLVAVNNNTGTRQDSQAVLMAQKVVETITSQPAASNPTFTVTDCRPNGLGGPQTFTINSAAGGANLNTGTNPGAIDFTQLPNAVPAGYQMTFFACGDTGDATTTDNTQIPFDVRWNVTIANGMEVLTVAARRMGNDGRAMAGKGLQTALFQRPVTFRTIVPQ